MPLKDAINNVLGFMWQQPLHQTLRQMRLIQVGLVINSQWLLWVIIDKLHVLEPTQAAIALGAIAAALITQIWASVASLSKSNSKDE